MKGVMAKPKAWIWFHVQKQYVPETCSASFSKKSELGSKPDSHQGERKSFGDVSTSSTDSSKKGTCGGWHSWCVTVFITIIFMCCAGWYTSWIKWRSITSNGLGLIWQRFTIFSLGATLCLFHNFRWFNKKAALAHHPIIQKEVDELLAKGATESSIGGVGFYLNVFVVTKHTGGLWSIFNLNQFNCYVCIPTFNMYTIRHV